MGAKVLTEGRQRALNSKHRGICKYQRQDPRTLEIWQPNSGAKERAAREPLWENEDKV